MAVYVAKAQTNFFSFHVIMLRYTRAHDTNCHVESCATHFVRAAPARASWPTLGSRARAPTVQ